MSNSLLPHGLQHARPPCASPTPGVYSNSCPSSQWCHPIISSSGIPFSSCPQSFPASGSFQMSQLFPSGQSIRVSASTSVLPMNTQDWSPLGWTGWTSLQILVTRHTWRGEVLEAAPWSIRDIRSPGGTMVKLEAMGDKTGLNLQDLLCSRDYP